MDPAPRRGDRLAAIALVLIAAIEAGLLVWTMWPAPEFLMRVTPWLVGFGVVFGGLAFGVWRGWPRAEIFAMGVAAAWALVMVWSILMRRQAIGDPDAAAYVAREFGAAGAMIALAAFALVRLARRPRAA